LRRLLTCLNADRWDGLGHRPRSDLRPRPGQPRVLAPRAEEHRPGASGLGMPAQQRPPGGAPAERPWPAAVPGRPNRKESAGPAEMRKTRPSRGRTLAGKPGLAARSEAHPGPNRRLGQTRPEAAPVLESRPSRGPRRPELARKSLTRPRTRMFRPARLESLYSGPQTHIPAGNYICRPGELYAGPGNTKVDPGHIYVGRDINMPART
jgi:hypothetical protein